MDAAHRSRHVRYPTATTDRAPSTPPAVSSATSSSATRTPASSAPPEKLNRQHQDSNMQIAYMTTPANLFHILRRQIEQAVPQA